MTRITPESKVGKALINMARHEYPHQSFNEYEWLWLGGVALKNATVGFLPFPSRRTYSADQLEDLLLKKGAVDSKRDASALLPELVKTEVYYQGGAVLCFASPNLSNWGTLRFLETTKDNGEPTYRIDRYNDAFLDMAERD